MVGLLLHLSKLDRWIITALTVFAGGWLFVALIFIDRNIYLEPIDPHVFAPPPHWYRFPFIPFVNPQSQRGHWIDGAGSIWLSSWTDVTGTYPDPTRSWGYFDVSKYGGYTHFRWVSRRVVKICGKHPALMQTYHAVWAGEGDAFTDVITSWGATLYWAEYVRPALARSDPAAMKAITRLCGGGQGVASGPY